MCVLLFYDVYIHMCSICMGIKEFGGGGVIMISHNQVCKPTDHFDHSLLV
jgi:hypothetical protein